ncbi:hypothetical protein ACFZAR_32250 [Streptomyces sp. NPDC008222]|uniref:hypothetical protein n=1 Tax=Streptomyces sp. NPDC008222 TaxID=3364820 RepID=UPI0036E39CE4
MSRERVGRRTQYTVNPDAPLRHPAETGLSVRALVEFLNGRAHEETDARTAQ